MTGPRLRVTVVDDHSLFAEALVIALESQQISARSVVPENASTTFAQLGRAIVKTQPHLVLLDLQLGIAGDAMRLVSTLSRGGIPVVMVTASADLVSQGASIAAGARAVINKCVPFMEIVDVVQRVADGLPVMTRRERDAIMTAYHDADDSSRDLHRKLASLTRREAEVLGQLMAGRQVVDIARRRFVSESTVRTQVKSILAKLEVSSQLIAVGLAHRACWHPPELEDPVGAGGRRTPRARARAAEVEPVRAGWNAAS
jgi:DNA-binding NarL/FixJ family response regulator